MDSLNKCIQEYTALLGKGQIQQAYRGILRFMSDLRASFTRGYPDSAPGALYFGYMDMTCFAFTPLALRNRKLKIAIVYLHQQNRFELWLAGNNRQTQAHYIELLSGKDLGGYALSRLSPGVDSIIAVSIAERPDFDHPDALKETIEAKTMAFSRDIEMLLKRIC